MRFEELREQFRFLRENGIQTEAQLKDFQKSLEDRLPPLTKQRTILNVRKKKRHELYAALSTEAALAPVKSLYEDGQTGFEAEYAQYMNAVKLLDSCGISREELSAEKARCYEKLANLNREIRQVRKKISMCQAILDDVPRIEKNIQKTEPQKQEVREHEYEQR